MVTLLKTKLEQEMEKLEQEVLPAVTAVWVTALQLAKFLKCKHASDVPAGHSENYNTPAIYKINRTFTIDPKILEIGCGYGRSTWAWLDVIPKNTDYYILDNCNLNFNDIFKWLYRMVSYLKT